MKADTLTRAITEAYRFIDAAKALKISECTLKPPKNLYRNLKVEQGTRTSAACKRASMDLSRALSDLRKGR